MDSLLVVSKRLGLNALREIYHFNSKLVSSVVTLDDRKDSRSCFNDILNYCDDNNIPLQTIEGPQLSELLIRLQPNFCLVCGWYNLISEPALHSCQYGVAGLHNSILPAYRGGAPLIWSIINDETTVGSSLFKMGPGMDDGDIIYQWRIDIGPNEYLPSILERLESTILENIGEVIGEYLSQTLIPKQQSSALISYCSQRTEEDSRINWSLSSRELYNLNRALQFPYPPLFFEKNGSTYLIEKLSIAAFPCYGKAGKVIAYTENGLLVKCGVGDDAVVVTDIRSDDDGNLAEHGLFPIGTLLTQ